MARIGYKLFGALLVLPWFVVPRPAPPRIPVLPTRPTVAAAPLTAAQLSPDSSERNRDRFADLQHDSWRRTNRGWERMESWPTASPAPQAQPEPIHHVHPWTIACLQALLCLAALLSSERRQNRTAGFQSAN